MYQYMCSTGSLLFIPSHLIIILVTLTERKSEQAVKVKIRCKATVCLVSRPLLLLLISAPILLQKLTPPHPCSNFLKSYHINTAYSLPPTSKTQAQCLNPQRLSRLCSNVCRGGGLGKERRGCGDGCRFLWQFDSQGRGGELSREVSDWHILVQGSTRHMIWHTNQLELKWRRNWMRWQFDES